MLRLRAILLTVLALLALCGPSFTTGICIGINGTGPYAATSARGDPVQLPSPCELMGGKRVMPAQPDALARRQIEVPRATDAQWQFGLSSDAIREGRGPMTELEPPRAA